MQSAGCAANGLFASENADKYEMMRLPPLLPIGNDA
jgi:hypothetical protein